MVNLFIVKYKYFYLEKWKQLKFDFLVDSILLRVSLSDFIDNYKISLENILELECIEQSPAPMPQLDLTDSDWVADVRTISEQWYFLQILSCVV
jgi:hypothetical protein